MEDTRLSERNDPLPEAGRRGSPRAPGELSRLVRPALVAFGAVLLLFALYEVVERVWLADAERELIFLLHRVRGAAAALLAAGMASWLILRRAPPLLVERGAGAAPGGGRTPPEERRLHFARWFVLMRWIAVVVAATLVAASGYIFGILPRELVPPLTAIVALLALANLGYALHLRRGRVGPRFLPVQVYTDVGVLVLLLHFSGGIENPLTPLTLLHVIIAGIVLDRRHAYGVAAVAGGLFALVAWAEWSGLIPHRSLVIFPHPGGDGVLLHPAHDSLFVASRVVLHLAILWLVAFFTSTLTDRIRHDEQRLERLATRTRAQAELLEEALETTQAAQEARIRAERLAALGQLAGQVAHEVNNPIAVLSAKARLLQRRDAHRLPEHTAAEIDKIIELADRVGRIAQGLLSFCRPVAATPSPLDVRVPVRRALEDVATRAAESGVRIRNELPDTLPPVLAGAGDLEQVFLNLFCNALDAMPQGGELRVSAAAAPVPMAGGVEGLEIVVLDTGHGVPPALGDRIFEPFLTTKAERLGSGLGLSICLGLLQSLGGEIALESETGRYTRVRVRLPTEAAVAGTNVSTATQPAEEVASHV